MTGFSLKDQLFNRNKVDYLADLLAAKNRAFAKDQFISAVMSRLGDLELKARIDWITTQLEQHLPEEFSKAAQSILRSLPPPLDPSKTDDDFGDYIFAPLGEYIARRGQSTEHFDCALESLKELTKRFSMEHAMRPFLMNFPEKTLKRLHEWVQDKNYHVRRLVSESTRPLLPWSPRLALPHSATLPLLDRLHADPTRYVTRSVANHLNDISKSDPYLVIECLEDWKLQKLQQPQELRWMTRHALRTMTKQGNASAMRVLGFNPTPKIKSGEIELKHHHVRLGNSLEFSIEICALRQESLVIDYAIDFLKSSGSHSRKVFKLTQVELSKGESVTVCKKHKLRAEATTFRLYPGEQRVTVQVNGVQIATTTFKIIAAK